MHVPKLLRLLSNLPAHEVPLAAEYLLRLFSPQLLQLPPAPHKDFSYLYEKMSGRGESAVLSRVNPSEPCCAARQNVTLAMRKLAQSNSREKERQRGRGREGGREMMVRTKRQSKQPTCARATDEVELFVHLFRRAPQCSVP